MEIDEVLRQGVHDEDRGHHVDPVDTYSAQTALLQR